MDYEQKYKEALERARMINNGEDVDVEAGTTTCEYIFPELKESEDEKIIKFLKKCVQQPMGTNFLGDINKADVLAWLEKQGEQKPIDYNEELKKCREYPLYFFDKYVKIEEHKPAWSKADKRMMDLIISVFEVNHPKSIFKDGLRAVYTDEIVSWLKSIEDRMKGE